MLVLGTTVTAANVVVHRNPVGATIFPGDCDHRDSRNAENI